MTEMTRHMRIGLAGVLTLAAAFSTTGFAQAQTAECACLVSQAALPATGPVGQLMNVSGNNVILTGPEGPAPAVEGASLQLGDQLAVGPQSSATFTVGNCSLQLPAQTEMSLAPANGNICVAVTETPAPVLGDVGMLALGGVAAGGAAAVILSLGDDSPASP